jgi:undecaprenyl-diphosphatase
MGNAFFTIGLALAIILFGKSDAKIVGWQALAALVSSHCLVQSLKLLLRRMRPFVTLKDVNILGKLPKDPSFPSGHSTASFALATSLTLYWPAIAAISMSAAVLVALSRVYLGYHYPSDIMAGTLLGIISALGMGWII